MNKTTIVAVIALIIAIIGVFTPSAAKLLGGVTNYDEIDATAIKIGSSGSRIGPIISGTCSLVASNYSVTASTTVPMDCAITGLLTTDTNIFVTFATSTVQSGGWIVTGESASSTAGYATIRVYNATGATAIIPASIASSTPYLVVRALTTVPGL